MNDIKLRPEHIEPVNRPRRIIFQYDCGNPDFAFKNESVSPDQFTEATDYYMSILDEEPNQIDSVWFNWGEGNIAAWPSRILPPPPRFFPQWWEAGIDPVQVLLAETRKRGREVFFSYRINGSDNEFGDYIVPKMKAEHPAWLIRPFPALPQVHWNFAFQEVRDYKVSILREVAQNYDFDGLQIDFSRIPVLFAPGEQWAHHELMTDFMRQVRLMTLDVQQQRGRH